MMTDASVPQPFDAVHCMLEDGESVPRRPFSVEVSIARRDYLRFHRPLLTGWAGRWHGRRWASGYASSTRELCFSFRKREQADAFAQRVKSWAKVDCVSVEVVLFDSSRFKQ